MRKYTVGDKFVIECKGYREGLEVYKMTGGIIVAEETLDELEEYKQDYVAEERQKAFEDGMNAAWDVARKIMATCKEGGLSLKETKEIFGKIFVGDIFMRFSAKEAKELIERYEDGNKICEGDVVEILEQKAVVLAIDNRIASVYVLTDQDAKVQEVPVYQLKNDEYRVDVRNALLLAYEIAKSFKETKYAMRKLRESAEETSKRFMEIHGDTLRMIKSGPPVENPPSPKGSEE